MIFDFDGLVVDTETPAYHAWSGIYREHGAELLLSDWVQCVGSGYGVFDPVKNLETLTGTVLDDEALKKRKDILKAEICLTQPLMPGILDRLREAQSLKMSVAVASSSGRDWIDLHSERTAITGFFSVVCTKEDVKQIKPAPDLYLLAAARLGVDPSDCIVLEDSQNGIIAARAAGMYAVAIPNFVTRHSDFSAAHLMIHSAAEMTLAELIKELI